MSHINDSFPFESPRHIENSDDCIFYHVMDLPGYQMPDAPWDLRKTYDEYIGNVDLNGKLVLDIGTATGFLTFEAEKRGATVVSFDIGEGKDQNLIPFAHKQYYQNHKEWAKQTTEHFEKWKNGYWLAHRLLNSKARVVYGNVYDFPKDVGLFDVTIVGSILEHLCDPVNALKEISKVTEDTMIIVADCLDSEEPIARFMASKDNYDQDYTWWFYSLGLYKQILGILGFKMEKIHKCKHLFVHTNTMAERQTIIAKRIVPLSLES